VTPITVLSASRLTVIVFALEAAHQDELRFSHAGERAQDFAAVDKRIHAAIQAIGESLRKR
jgi:hypothetical protein